MDLVSRWILKFLSNIFIKKSIPLLFSELVYDISLGVSGDSDKISVVPLLENEDLIYVHHEELGVFLSTSTIGSGLVTFQSVRHSKGFC